MRKTIDVTSSDNTKREAKETLERAEQKLKESQGKK
jgi:hypothetical protein